MTEWLDAGGDIVTGDTIRWTEAVFKGSYRRPKFAGERIITATVIRDSYGEEKQQHTFTLAVISAEGHKAQEVLDKKTIRRKGRNIYRNGVQRLPWTDEDARDKALDEKHSRGDTAQSEREFRKKEQWL